MEVFNLVAELGVPIAGALIMAYFIFLVMKQLMDGLVAEIKTIQGITQMLITRASITVSYTHLTLPTICSV